MAYNPNKPFLVLNLANGEPTIIRERPTLEEAIELGVEMVLEQISEDGLAHEEDYGDLEGEDRDDAPPPPEESEAQDIRADLAKNGIWTNGRGDVAVYIMQAE